MKCLVKFIITGRQYYFTNYISADIKIWKAFSVALKIVVAFRGKNVTYDAYIVVTILNGELPALLRSFKIEKQ